MAEALGGPDGMFEEAKELFVYDIELLETVSEPDGKSE